MSLHDSPRYHVFYMMLHFEIKISILTSDIVLLLTFNEIPAPQKKKEKKRRPRKK